MWLKGLTAEDFGAGPQRWEGCRVWKGEGQEASPLRQSHWIFFFALAVLESSMAQWQQREAWVEAQQSVTEKEKEDEKEKPKLKKKDIMLWRNGAKERKASRGGGDVKAPNIPQKHSAAVPLVAVQSVKAVGFQYKLIFSSSFYRASWSADHWDTLPSQLPQNPVHPTPTLLPLSLRDMIFPIFYTSLKLSCWKNSMSSMLPCLLWNYGDLTSYFPPL